MFTLFTLHKATQMSVLTLCVHAVDRAEVEVGVVGSDSASVAQPEIDLPEMVPP